MNLFKSISISKILIVSFLMIVALFSGINIFTYFNVNRLIQSAAIEKHTVEVLKRLESILSSLSDAETGQRGFLLTGKLKYLEPYHSGITNVEGEIFATKKLTSDNQIQQDRIIVLEELVVKKKNELQETVDLRTAGKQDEAIAIVLSDKGKDIMDQIRVVIRDMKNEETALLEVRQAAFADSETLTRIIILFGSLAGLILALYIALVISGFIGKSVARLRYVASEIAKGNMDIAVDTTGRSEISHLAQSIETMKQHLKEAFADKDQREKLLNIRLHEADDAKKTVMNILKDVETEKENFRKQLLETKKFLMAVDSATDGIIITDPKVKIIYVNKAWEQLTGYSSKEVLGKNPNISQSGKTSEKVYKDMWRALEAGKSFTTEEIVNKRKDGKEYNVHLSIFPIIENKKTVFYVGLEQDISKRKEIDKAKTEFVSLASHQLRTPLSSINWYIEMLLNEDIGKINKEQKDYLEIVDKANKRMIRLVGDLLNVSRLELGTFIIESEKVDLVLIAKSVLDEFEPTIKEKKIKVVREFSKSVPIIDNDPELARMILQNLISNAIKYTPSGGEIKVALAKKESNVLITVSDTGYGIPKDQHSKIFTKLFRADNIREKDTDGTGLGLYIAKSIISNMNGKIWFKSPLKEISKAGEGEGVGTAFYVELPISGVKSKVGTKRLRQE